MKEERAGPHSNSAPETKQEIGARDSCKLGLKYLASLPQLPAGNMARVGLFIHSCL